MNKLNIAFLSLLLFYGINAFAEVCNLEGFSGATMFVYCPSNIADDKLVPEIKLMAAKYLHPKLKQVHINVFNNKNLMPKNTNEFMEMSDQLIDQLLIAQYSFNENTKYISFSCVDHKTKKMTNCLAKFK